MILKTLFGVVFAGILLLSACKPAAETPPAPPATPIPWLPEASPPVIPETTPYAVPRQGNHRPRPAITPFQIPEAPPPEMDW